MNDLISYNSLLRTGIYTGANVAVEFGKGMSPDMATFMDSIVYWISSWLYKRVVVMWGGQVCDNGGGCMSCTMRNIFIVVMELLYDGFMYGGFPGITDVLQQITAVFSVDLAQGMLFKGA